MPWNTKILSDTGWKETQPYRCCRENRRTVVFAEGTLDAVIEGAKAQLETDLPVGQEMWVKRDGFKLEAYSFFCDSSD